MQDGVVAAENSGAFVHLLYENTVDMVGPFDREHLLPAWAVHHNGIHLTGTNGTEGFLGFVQACDQFLARQGRRLSEERLFFLLTNLSAFYRLLVPLVQI